MVNIKKLQIGDEVKLRNGEIYKVYHIIRNEKEGVTHIRIMYAGNALIATYLMNGEFLGWNPEIRFDIQEIIKPELEEEFL